MYKQYTCLAQHSQSARVAEALRVMAIEGYRLVSVTQNGMEISFHLWRDITE